MYFSSIVDSGFQKMIKELALKVGNKTLICSVYPEKLLCSSE